MLFFAFLGFGEGFDHPAAWHVSAATAKSPLLFRFLAFFGRGNRRGLGCVGMAAHAFIVPTMEELHIDVELIENPRDGLIDDVIQSLGAMIERRHRRENNRAHARERGHRFQMAEMQRRLAYDQHELFSFFQYHVGGAHQQVAAERMGDGAHGFHRTRHNHHPFGAKRSARNARADVADVMNDVGHRFHVFHGKRRLHLDRHPAGFAHDEVRFDVVDLGEDLQHAHAVDRAGRSRDANDQSFFLIQLRNSHVS